MKKRRTVEEWMLLVEDFKASNLNITAWCRNREVCKGSFYPYLKKSDALPKSALGKAVYYSLSQWKYLENYILDGRCEISNNRAKRSIKPFVIGRKNFLFADTVRGAKASAIIYSIIETAKENGLNPMNYLTYLFEKIPNMDLKNNLDLFEFIFPWGSLPEECYLKKKD